MNILPASLLLIQTLFVMAEPSGEKPGAPVEPIAAILREFQRHQLVAVGEGSHGNEPSHRFRVALIRDGRFAETVNDIVVEFGNSRFQDVMDRYLRGETVPSESLRPVWMDTTQPDTIWDRPIYEEFFQEVRKVNEVLPEAKKIRVLLGDPPIDWQNIKTRADLDRFASRRDSHAAEVIQREVLSKNHRALIIYGDEHLAHKNGLIGLLEKSGQSNIFCIHTETRADLTTVQADAAHWPKPSLLDLAGTTVGQFKAGGMAPLSERFDALLYLGPPYEITLSELPKKLCHDPNYMAMRLQRMSLVPPPPGAPFIPSQRLKDYCALGETNVEIPDDDPAFRELFENTILAATEGKSESDHFAPESREQLTRFLGNYGPLLLKPMGALQSVLLTGKAENDGRRLRAYRATFAHGKILWIVSVAPDGLIRSLDPHKE
jgi:hypothetical protein